MKIITISYAPLFNTIKQKGATQKEVFTAAKISGTSRQNLRTNKCVTTTVILRLCKVLKCNINDIMKLVTD